MRGPFRFQERIQFKQTGLSGNQTPELLTLHPILRTIPMKAILRVVRQRGHASLKRRSRIRIRRHPRSHQCFIRLLQLEDHCRFSATSLQR